MACPVIVDLRNVYRPDEVERHGFVYLCVGRPNTLPPIGSGAARASASSSTARKVLESIDTE
jgi:hypothetical protein